MTPVLTYRPRSEQSREPESCLRLALDFLEQDGPIRDGGSFLMPPSTLGFFLVPYPDASCWFLLSTGPSVCWFPRNSWEAGLVVAEFPIVFQSLIASEIIDLAMIWDRV